MPGYRGTRRAIAPRRKSNGARPVGQRQYGRRNFTARRGRGAPRNFRGRRPQFNSHLEKSNSLIPPPSFSNSRVPRTRDAFYVKRMIKADTPTLDEFNSCWIENTESTQDCVFDLYLNVSGVAIDSAGVTAAPKLISKVHNISVSANSSNVKIYLMSGKVVRAANNSSMELVRSSAVQSNPLKSGRTGILKISDRPVALSQKGPLIQEIIPLGFTTSFKYAFVGRFSVSISKPSIASGNVGYLDIRGSYEVVPNPDVKVTTGLTEPPDLIIMGSKDPSSMLRSFNNEAGFSTVTSVQVGSMTVGVVGSSTTYLAYMDGKSFVPRPADGQLYRVSPPVTISVERATTTYIDQLAFARFYVNSNVAGGVPYLFFYTTSADAMVANGTNNGTATGTVQVSSGVNLIPVGVQPPASTGTNQYNAEFEAGDSVLITSREPSRTQSRRSRAARVRDDIEIISDNDSIVSGMQNIRFSSEPPIARRRYRG